MTWLATMLIVGVYLGIIILLVAIAMSAQEGDRIEHTSETILDSTLAPPIGRSAAEEFGYPMPSTTQPAFVQPVSGYTNKHFEREYWKPAPHNEPWRMGI